MRHLEKLKYDNSSREHNFNSGKIIFVHEDNTDENGVYFTDFNKMHGILGIEDKESEKVEILYLTEKRWFTTSEVEYLLGKDVIIYRNGVLETYVKVVQ